MKYLYALIIALMIAIICIITSACFADSINVKGGLAVVACEGVNPSPVGSLSYELNPTLRGVRVGVEMGLKGYSTKLHDTQVEHAWLVGKEMGVLNVVAPFATLKVYLPYNLYV